MNSLMFCLFFCISSSLGLSVSFAHYNDNSDELVTELSCKRHEFIYHRGDFFGLVTTIHGTESDTMMSKVAVFVKKSAGTILFRQQMPIPYKQTVVDINLDYDEIIIDVQQSTADSCEMIRVLEGREVSTLPEAEKNFKTSKNNNICLNGLRCWLMLNMSNHCTNSDEQFEPQPCKVDDDDKDVSIDVDEEQVRKGLIAARTFFDFITQTNSSTTNAPSTSTAPNAENAPNNSNEGADNTYFTIMIVALVIAAVVSILLVLIILRLCWVCNPQVARLPPFSPINEDRYYENVVFRPKSEQEASQRESQIYDEPSVETSQEASHRRPQLN